MSVKYELDAEEAAEAQAFDERIRERAQAGLIPDLRRAVKCEYFYKSFWRDPHFLQLYVGQRAKLYLDWLGKHGGAGLRILDVGCGAGYFSLELARAGHHVTAIDISETSIEVAQKTLDSNPFKEGFGSLEYRVMPFREVSGSYDVVLFSGTIHHFENVEEIVKQAAELLPAGGLLMCAEPCHEEWRMEDAAQVAMIRALLSLTGFWYETSLGDEVLESEAQLASYINDVHTEYVTEQDKHEHGGQSPHDNSSTGEEIIATVSKYFQQLEYKPQYSFTYRLLGGLRGPDEVVHKIADFLAMYDDLAVSQGYMKPNMFTFLGRKLA